MATEMAGVNMRLEVGAVRYVWQHRIWVISSLLPQRVALAQDSWGISIIILDRLLQLWINSGQWSYVLQVRNLTVVIQLIVLVLNSSSSGLSPNHSYQQQWTELYCHCCKYPLYFINIRSVDRFIERWRSMVFPCWNASLDSGYKRGFSRCWVPART